MKLSIERVVALVTPIFAAGSAWITSAVAKYGVHLNATGITAAAVAGATVGLGAAWKWLDGRAKFVNLEKQLESVGKTAAPIVGEIDPTLAKQIETAAQDAVDKVVKAIGDPSALLGLPSDAQEIASPPPADQAVETPPVAVGV